MMDGYDQAVREMSEADLEVLSLKALQSACYSIASQSGWHQSPERKGRTVGDYVSLMHSELSESLEEYRHGHEIDEVYYSEGDTPDHPKPEGVVIELADCVIRILDFCEKHGLDLGWAVAHKLAYNRTRAYRHGDKRF